ncbi:MAG: M20 family metallopeptidase [Turicibacter sp.]|nr:M20 family metallopeptidase [Turicibacter sp.]
MREKIEQLINERFDQFVHIRRDFHRHPELGLEEFRTADKIENYLKEWGIDVGERINGTSVVGMIKGISINNPKIIALRADIDALPIEEKSSHSYRSVYPGVMHACGHDVHITIQLGAAYVLSQLRDAWPGHVKLFFQQAEETVGGAQTMIDAGVLDAPHVSHVLGFHVCPKLNVGTLGIKSGPTYASSDTITLDVHGQAAHAASPQDGIDAIVVASHILAALQTLVSRSTSPLDAAVLSFGQIVGGKAHNVICDHVRLRGTMRTLDNTVRTTLKNRLFEIVNHIAKAYGAEVVLRVESGYDAVINDADTTVVVERVAKQVLGEDQVVQLEHPSLGVEDFAYFAKARPSSYNRLGVANPARGITAPVHDGRFDVDEEAIRHGILIQVLSVLALMGVAYDD